MQVKAVIFDKTGTLTTGHPEVTNVLLYISGSICPQWLFLTLVGLAESVSEHPLGEAVVSFVQEGLGGPVSGQTSDFEAVPGKGLRCTVTGIDMSDGDKSSKNNVLPSKDVMYISSALGTGKTLTQDSVFKVRQ